jgi:hydroxyquinol 1,2-dioxygenase
MIDLDETTITAEVIRRFRDTPDPRLKRLIEELVVSLHDYARKVELTEAEWMAAIGFLTDTGHKCSETRQEFILLSDTLGLSQLVVALNHKRGSQFTEQTVFGPFFVEGAPTFPAHGGDLAPRLPGTTLFVTGSVRAAAGPVGGARVDTWQADAEGFYDVQDNDWSTATARLRGTLLTDETGAFSFRSIMPVSYPIPTDGPVGLMLDKTRRHPMRPAHLHFMVQAPSVDTLITHAFVAKDEYLDDDAVFGVRRSCVQDFVTHPSGRRPDGVDSAEPFVTLHCDLVVEAKSN